MGDGGAVLLDAEVDVIPKWQIRERRLEYIYTRSGGRGGATLDRGMFRDCSLTSLTVPDPSLIDEESTEQYVR